MDDQNVISVIIVEDDNEIRQLMTFLIEKTNGFNCLASFSDCENALQPIIDLQPDVVLMDIELPGISGIQGILGLKEKVKNTDFIMLTIRDDDDSIFNSLKAGASGYILKDTAPAKILEAIVEVNQGGSPMTGSIARRITESFQPLGNSILSERENEVLTDLCKGMNYREIGEKHFISGHTVRTHIKTIYSKLHVHSRAEAVRKAIDQRLI
ncbi:MAG: response regulator transcription factor [Flavobacteriales bacterium]|nr:response regulator transcription factor [Flavobacteriales bacterium]